MRPYKIAFASGKGGTGKTTISVQVFNHFRKLWSEKIMLVDCDVEEPNTTIYFDAKTLYIKEKVYQLIPRIDLEKCSFCRRCVTYCEFNAIVVIPPAKFAQVNASLCHSCGACSVACHDKAITEVNKTVGEVSKYHLPDGSSITEGRLAIGSSMQTMLIKKLKERVGDGYHLVLYDAPPGTSCPLVETIADVDYVILVAEPTPFGLHDMKLTMNLLKQMNVPFGVIINKCYPGNNPLEDFLRKEKTTIIGRIPFDKQFAVACAEGKMTESIPQNISDLFVEIGTFIQKKSFHNERNYDFER